MTLTAKIKRHRDLLILCFCLSCSALATGVYYDMLNRQSESGIEQIRTVYTERAENLINSVFHKTDVLAAAVKLTNGSISYRTFNEIASLNGIPEDLKQMLERKDDLGTWKTHNHYPVAWAHAMNAPFQIGTGERSSELVRRRGGSGWRAERA